MSEDEGGWSDDEEKELEELQTERISM